MCVLQYVFHPLLSSLALVFGCSQFDHRSGCVCVCLCATWGGKMAWTREKKRKREREKKKLVSARVVKKNYTGFFVLPSRVSLGSCCTQGGPRGKTKSIKNKSSINQATRNQASVLWLAGREAKNWIFFSPLTLSPSSSSLSLSLSSSCSVPRRRKGTSL